MQFSVVMWSVWGVFAAFFVVIRLYAMSLGRDENDEILLHAGLAHLQAEQVVIAARLNKVEPVKRTAFWMVSAMSLLVIAYYVVNIIRQFQ
jgi:hypothetical protein